MSKRFTKEKRKKGFGNLIKQEKVNVIPYYLPDPEFFDAITDESIESGDWLEWKKKERGQTYDKFSGYNPVTLKRKTIYIVPLEKTTHFKMNELIEFLQIFYTKKVNVKTLDTRKIRNFAQRVSRIKTRKSRGYGKQYYVPDIFSIVKSIMPLDAYCLIALTKVDLFPNDDWNFVFGKASLRGRFGVFSYARYLGEGEEHKIFRRVCSVSAHEIGHMFYFKHCTYYRCMMNGSNSMEESDGRRMILCPICLRKLMKVLKTFKIKGRYEGLFEFYEKHKIKEVEWITKRLKHIKEVQGKKLSKKELKKMFDKME